MNEIFKGEDNLFLWMFKAPNLNRGIGIETFTTI